MDKKKTKTIHVETREVPIKWNIPDNIITRFANNVVIQKIENVFKISFFETKPDILLGNLQDTISTEVQADCVASIVMTPDKLAKLTGILQTQLELYQAKNKNGNNTN
jgi:hypothetical protein